MYFNQCFVEVDVMFTRACHVELSCCEFTNGAMGKYSWLHDRSTCKFVGGTVKSSRADCIPSLDASWTFMAIDDDIIFYFCEKYQPKFCCDVSSCSYNDGCPALIWPCLFSSSVFCAFFYTSYALNPGPSVSIPDLGNLLYRPKFQQHLLLLVFSVHCLFFLHAADR